MRSSPLYQQMAHEELQLQRDNVHYITTLHWAAEIGCETHKKSPRPGGHAHRTVQYDIEPSNQSNNSTRPRISTRGHTRSRICAGDIASSINFRSN